MNTVVCVGKKVVDDLYLHIRAIDGRLDGTHTAAVRELLAQIAPSERYTPNVVKFNQRDGRLSLLSYPDFDESPFPQLAASWTQASSGLVRCRLYDQSLNPPILHRKELLVPTDWPGREAWARTTELAESLGLFDHPHTIGLRGNWEQLLASKGYCVQGGQLLPIGNETEAGRAFAEPGAPVLRHLTALTRSSLSAPIQLLLRSGLLVAGTSLFDYGCGRGDDVRSLSAAGFVVGGWDPYYAQEQPRVQADLVNLGFVINVIEDPLERAEALRCAATLARKLLAVSVMLHNSASGGVAFSDGVLSSRNTFQKYFHQEELRDYLEHALGLPVIMVAPGMALLFKDRALEQSFLISRYRRKDVAVRLLASSRIARVPKSPKLRIPRERNPTVAQSRREELRPHLSELWELALELGRWPVAEEVSNLAVIEAKGSSLARALRLVQRTCDAHLFDAAAQSRRDDVLLYLAMQQFSKRPAYKRLDDRLQRDIRTFFGTYGAAYSAAAALLRDTGDPEKLLEASRHAADRGLGFLADDHSLQLHISMVDRLPPILRAYVGCGLVLWDETSAVQLVKIHIHSGKLTLQEFEEFDGALLPRLRRRVKINLRKVDYQIFEYGNATNPMPLLYGKSRYINEEYPGYESQAAFDEELRATGVLERTGEYGPAESQLLASLELQRLRVGERSLEPSNRIPELDQACGQHFTYGSFVACGETQRRLGTPNVPLRPETYNALHALATLILDPVIEYFGGIRLTYGFSSRALASKIERRISPKLDQHAGCELTQGGALICARGGAACDFVVQDENMREVAEWIMRNSPFDRLYFYGEDRPVHVSYSAENSRQAYAMRATASGALIPRRYSTT